MIKFVLVLAICLGGFLYKNPQVWRPFLSPRSQHSLSASNNGSGQQQQKNIVYMYSLSTCGICKSMASSMTEAGISYVEYMIDEDPNASQEVGKRLYAAGVPGGSVGAPILFVGDKMFSGRTPMSDIQAAMQ